MITKAKLINFKSHRDTEIGLSNLTVLCGSNGVGKSSFIQILLLLREAFLKDKSFDILDLKSNPVKIGTAEDSIYEFGEQDGFGVDLQFQGIDELKFHYHANTADELTKSFIKLNKSASYLSETTKYGELSLFNTHFQYISAARKGPQDRYDKDDKIVDVHKQISVIEGQAEYFVHFLDKYGNDDILTELLFASRENADTRLAAQVGLWEKYIFNGANTEVHNAGKLGFVLKYSFDTDKIPMGKSSSVDAKNVGFGLTYTLPLLVAILSAQKGSIIIIENPEAHLHPNGIAKLTELICQAAQAGIQIILETHSDHIINGILVQSKKFEKLKTDGIDRNNVRIYQFDRNEQEYSCEAEYIPIHEGGRIRYAPSGFFDQFKIDSKYLLLD